MDAKVAQLIVEAGGDVELREDYSGRCMYGEKTCAVVCSSFSEFVAAVAAAAGGLDPAHEDEVIEDIVLACQSLRHDQMGLGIVVY